MDLGSIPPELSGQIARVLVPKVLSAMGAKIRREIVGTPREAALEWVYQQATQSFLESLPEAASDYLDVIEEFFSDEIVIEEFAQLLAPSGPIDVDIETLHERFNDLGFDVSTMPGFDFEYSLMAFASAFTAAAAGDRDLLSILSYHGIQRIEVQLSTLIALQERSSTRVEDLASKVVEQSQEAKLHPDDEESAPTRRVRFVTQRFFRYVSFAFDESLPPEFLDLLQGVSMADQSWIEESRDAVELTVAPGDFVFIVETMQRVTKRAGSKGAVDIRTLLASVKHEIIAQAQTAIKRQKSGRPAVRRVRTLDRQEVSYLVLGVVPEFAPLFDIFLQLAHFGNRVPIIERNQREVHFESLEDLVNVLSVLQKASADSNGDPDKLALALTQGVVDRAFKKALFVAGIDLPADSDTDLASSIETTPDPSEKQLPRSQQSSGLESRPFHRPRQPRTRRERRRKDKRG